MTKIRIKLSKYFGKNIMILPIVQIKFRRVNTKKIIFVLIGLIPIFSFAATVTPTSVADFVKSINCLALDFVPMIVLFAFVAFITGLVGYVAAGDNEEKRSEGRKFMIYGMLGFFFMVAVWGILGMFTNSYGLKLQIPQFRADSTTAANSVNSCGN